MTVSIDDLSDYKQTTWNIKGLGEITGWDNPDKTVQFFGVPYADLEARFRHSTLKTSWSENACDCTKLRGYCPQPHRVFYPFLVPDRPHAGKMYMDEWDSLNMQITLPPGTKPTDKLPVLVYVHGGAFIFGTGNYSILDGKALANLSAELGMPTIIISINYRTGFFGFLCSDDIAEDNLSQGYSAGNYTLNDQKNAFLWINKYIGSFGGDPARVLVAGQSAGAASMDVHLRAPHNDLFSSVILLSGTAPICGVYTPEEYQILYYKLLGVLGISRDLPPRERLEQLRAAPHQALSRAAYIVFQGLNGPQFGIGTDVSVFGKGFELLKASQYPGSKLPFKGKLIMGDCKHEGIIYSQSFEDHTGATAIETINKYLKEPFLSEYISHYGITAEMDAKEAFPCIEALLSDSMFIAPPYYIASANPEQCYAYHFNQVSRFDNAWGGFAHHSLDYMFTFGNIASRLTESENALARQMGSDFISFANGIDPYPPTSEGHRVYGPNEACEVTQTSPRDTAWFDKMAPYMDELMKMAADFNVRQPELLSEEFGPGTKNERDVPQVRDEPESIS